MLFVQGLCIKCSRRIIGTPYYNQISLDLEAPEGKKHEFKVGVCSGCDITESDFEDIRKAYNDYHSYYGNPLELPKIKAVIKRQTFADCLKETQQGKCLGCHKEIGEKWIVTGNVVLHEGCNLPPPAPLQERSQGSVRKK